MTIEKRVVARFLGTAAKGGADFKKFLASIKKAIKPIVDSLKDSEDVFLDAGGDRLDVIVGKDSMHPDAIEASLATKYVSAQLSKVSEAISEEAFLLPSELRSKISEATRKQLNVGFKDHLKDMDLLVELPGALIRGTKKKIPAGQYLDAQAFGKFIATKLVKAIAGIPNVLADLG